MKRIAILLGGTLALCALGAVVLHHRSASKPGTAPTPEPVASVSVARPQRAQVETTVGAFGDVMPAKVQSVSFARAGLLAMLPVVVGQRVSQGSVVGRLTGDPTAQASYQQARSSLTLAEGEAQRTQSLFKLQLATASQVETARKAASDARANVDAQELLGGASTASDALAPFDGVVMALSAAQGDRLAAGAPILQVGRVDRLKVNAGIEPAERHLVKLGASVALQPLQTMASAPATPAPREVTGTVVGLQDLVDPKTQLVSASIEIAPAASSLLVPGMRVSARIRTGQQVGWLVPRPSVLTDDKGTYVFQVKAGKAHRVPVAVVSDRGDSISVSGPIVADEPVVSLGNYELSDGMQVRETAK